MDKLLRHHNWRGSWPATAVFAVSAPAGHPPASRSAGKTIASTGRAAGRRCGFTRTSSSGAFSCTCCRGPSTASATMGSSPTPTAPRASRRPAHFDVAQAAPDPPAAGYPPRRAPQWGHGAAQHTRRVHEGAEGDGLRHAVPGRSDGAGARREERARFLATNQLPNQPPQW
jgi:hypothetical protein